MVKPILPLIIIICYNMSGSRYDCLALSFCLVIRFKFILSYFVIFFYSETVYNKYLSYLILFWDNYCLQ
jgi:hypothetical protein